jgi:2-hydroxychromene-2-carboxylate isomerase
VSLRRRVSPWIAQLLTSPRTRAARRTLAEVRRRLRREPHRVRYFHQVDDPYSHLSAQVLAPLVERYAIELEPHLVGPPPDDAAPDRARLEAYSLRDAADVAPGYGLEFPEGKQPLDASQVDLASMLLAGAIDSGQFPAVASRVSTALFAGDGAALESLARELPRGDAAAAVERGTHLRAQLGHYLGATFHQGVEWFWGVDRLSHLERRLRELGLGEAAPIAPRPVLDAGSPGGRSVRIECFPSLRSPYSAIAMRRVLELPARLPVEIVWRPVLPMVMRGLPVPRAKQLYIALDTKREAEQADEPFGRICDPVGRPVERGFSLFPWAREHGHEGEYLHAFTRAAFAEGIDTGEDAGLRHVVERAGLSWQEARARLDGDEWRGELEENRQAMLGAGLWGVPSFRIPAADGHPEYSTWGQDRLWRVEQEVLRRANGTSS